MSAEKEGKKPEKAKRRNLYENVYPSAISISPISKVASGDTIKLLAEEAAPFGDLLKMVRR